MSCQFHFDVKIFFTLLKTPLKSGDISTRCICENIGAGHILPAVIHLGSPRLDSISRPLFTNSFRRQGPKNYSDAREKRGPCLSFERYIWGQDPGPPTHLTTTCTATSAPAKKIHRMLKVFFLSLSCSQLEVEVCNASSTPVPDPTFSRCQLTALTLTLSLSCLAAVQRATEFLSCRRTHMPLPACPNPNPPAPLRK